jgi:hypothetical protein
MSQKPNLVVVNPVVQKIDEAFSLLILRVLGSQMRAPQLYVRPKTVRYIYNEWMAGIMVSTPEMPAIIKLHFNHPTIELFHYNFSRFQIDDLMKESCNHLAGAIKTNFLAIEVEAGISLPFITPGIDEIFFSDQREKSSLTSAIDVYSGDTRLLTFSYDLRIMDESVLKMLPRFAEITKENAVAEGINGEVEML